MARSRRPSRRRGLPPRTSQVKAIASLRSSPKSLRTLAAELSKSFIHDIRAGKRRPAPAVARKINLGLKRAEKPVQVWVTDERGNVRSESVVPIDARAKTKLERNRALLREAHKTDEFDILRRGYQPRRGPRIAGLSQSERRVKVIVDGKVETVKLVTDPEQLKRIAELEAIEREYKESPKSKAAAVAA
jgi:hypothetical protein